MKSMEKDKDDGIDGGIENRASVQYDNTCLCSGGSQRCGSFSFRMHTRWTPAFGRSSTPAL